MALRVMFKVGDLTPIFPALLGPSGSERQDVRVMAFFMVTMKRQDK